MMPKSNIYNIPPRHQYMPNSLVNLRIPRELLKDTTTIAREEGFSNPQEFIREALRQHVRKYKMEQSLRELDRLAGSAKGKKLPRVSKAEMRRHIEEIFS
jgi:hypothetical protein